MSKQRIYEYAKELNLKSKEIIDELKSMNIEVSNHMQALEDDQIKALDKKFKKEQKNDNKQSTQNNHQKSNNQNQNKGQQKDNKKNQQQK
ncbi:protein translation initiation factor 2 (IF-2) [Staphylococcus aureus]|uniref:Protein translation initiation factor 2 (IF-2) n=2 Tax=Staphylococcus aureus TaxID=1280 RepID=A0A380DQS3_STAAU|nr:protein translation initiation factor 2 (IF-2) [Staphylococcus aureus]